MAVDLALGDSPIMNKAMYVRQNWILEQCHYTHVSDNGNLLKASAIL